MFIIFYRFRSVPTINVFMYDKMSMVQLLNYLWIFSSISDGLLVSRLFRMRNHILESGHESFHELVSFRVIPFHLKLNQSKPIPSEDKNKYLKKQQSI